MHENYKTLRHLHQAKEIQLNLAHADYLQNLKCYLFLLNPGGQEWALASYSKESIPRPMQVCSPILLENQFSTTWCRLL